MAVSLQKGQKADITRNNPGLTKVVVGLGWDINKYDGGVDFDLDAVVFLLGDNEKVTNDNDFVFYNNLEHPSGSVIHSGDNRTGVGEGDDERIMVDLSKIPTNVSKIAFAVTIHEGENRGQNFGQISNDYIRVYNEKNEEELIRYDLGEDFSIETAVVVGEIYRYDGEWKFNAVGSGFRGGLEALCNNFGVNV